jgi:hypothetical protein
LFEEGVGSGFADEACLLVNEEGECTHVASWVSEDTRLSLAYCDDFFIGFGGG